MEYFELKVTDDDELPIYVNAAEVVSVTGNDADCEVSLSNKQTYHIQGKSAKRLLAYLHANALINA